MTLEQAIDVLEYRHKWFNIKTINATLGDIHALFSFQEKWQSEYGTNPFDDRVMMDAIAVIIDHHRSPSRPQESDTEPTPEPFTPKEGEVLIAIDSQEELDGQFLFTVGQEYKAISYDGARFIVCDNYGFPISYLCKVAHKYFKRKEVQPIS